MDLGKSNLFNKYLNFLISEYDMKFSFQIFSDYKGFYGPIYTYSYYNSNGCLTFHNIAQRGEWGIYTSRFYKENDQYILLQNEIIQTDYINKSYFSTKNWLRDLSKIMYNMSNDFNYVFSIKLNRKVD